ncbi:MAG: methionyl-tRNA formyltransferase [Ruminococcaceae bacterium]|nr:methionyl-tRNA formyltransferase [Oscillospiraceae bacterium]
MRIVFMGTPDIAVGTLKALLNSKHEIVGVFTQPDKPVGRKQILTPPPVKVCAKENGIPVYQPTTLKTNEAYEILKELNPDIIVVVAYGKILPKNILDLPRFGCINGHASILPKYRGSAPIQWSIVYGEKETGITVQRMDEGVDTGDIIDIKKVPILPNETADELYEKLTETAAELICETLGKIENGTATFTKQNENEATYAPMIKKEMAYIDFSKTASDIHNLVRGFYSWPTAYFMFGDRRLKVYKTEIGGSTNAAPATVIKSDGELVIACGDNTSVKLLDIQLEGSKRMDVKQWLMGKKIETGIKIQ